MGSMEVVAPKWWGAFPSPKVLPSVPSRIKGLSCSFSPGLCVGNRWAAHTLAALPGSLPSRCATQLGQQPHPRLCASWLLGLCLASALGEHKQLCFGHQQVGPRAGRLLKQ